jgi:hypothetical protein
MDYLTDCIETLRRRMKMAERDRGRFVAKRAWSAEVEAEVNEIDTFLEWATAEMEALREALWVEAQAVEAEEVRVH